MGYIIARDRKAANRWRARSRKSVATSDGGLRGMALERAVMGLARRNPEYVVVGTA